MRITYLYDHFRFGKWTGVSHYFFPHAEVVYASWYEELIIMFGMHS